MNSSKTRSKAKRITVAFQGAHGAFSEEAAHKLLGPNLRTLPCRTFDEIFHRVASQQTECCLAPIENSLAGSIRETYDLLLDYDLKIIAETSLRIVHNLIVPPGVKFKSIRTVMSHPVALAQCERFFRENPQIQPEVAYDTAGSVKMIVQSGASDRAAIAGRAAAAAYGAKILVEGVEDNAKNFTRFLLLCRDDAFQIGRLKKRVHRLAKPERKKTSVVFNVANVPGSLFKCLAAFSLRDINLTKLESRPLVGRPWEYTFYLDLIGDVDEPKIQAALSQLSETTEYVRTLGSYVSPSE